MGRNQDICDGLGGSWREVGEEAAELKNISFTMRRGVLDKMVKGRLDQGLVGHGQGKTMDKDMFKQKVTWA